MKLFIEIVIVAVLVIVVMSVFDSLTLFTVSIRSFIRC